MKLKLSPKDRLIFALDIQAHEVRKYLALLKDHVGMFKVGLQVYLDYGPGIIELIRLNGCKVFLDLKFHDIPNTVAAAINSASKQDIEFMTIHISDGYNYLKEIGTKAPLDKVVGVTTLTSQKTRAEDIVMLAKNANLAGLKGVVCSGKEASLVRYNTCKDFTIITPGIRLPNAATDDQQRIVTPFEAINGGADYIVVGRPISMAVGIRQTTDEIVKEIELALKASDHDIEHYAGVGNVCKKCRKLWGDDEIQSGSHIRVPCENR